MSYLDGGYLAGDDAPDYGGVVADSAQAQIPRDLINPNAPEPLSPWMPTVDRFKGALMMGGEPLPSGGGFEGIERIPAMGAGGLGGLFLGRRLSPKARWAAVAIAAYLGATRGVPITGGGPSFGRIVHSGAAAATLGLLASALLGKREKG